MTIPRYTALRRHWQRHPRPEWLIAGYLGYKPPPEPAIVAGKTRHVPPPTGAMMALFAQYGGTKGKIAVINP